MKKMLSARLLLAALIVAAFMAVPALAQTGSTGGNNSGNAGTWTAQNWIALVTAIFAGITGLIGAVAGLLAKGKADANSESLNSHRQEVAQQLNTLSARLNTHGEQLVNLAAVRPGIPTPPTGGGGN